MPEKRVPPYPPHALFARFLKELKDLGIPRRIDKSIFPGLRNAASSSLLKALGYLDLIGNDGIPSDSLVHLIEAQVRPEALEPIVRGAYAFVFNDQADLSCTSAENLADRFRSQQLSGGTVQKAVAFFLALAREAHIPISGDLARRKHPARSEPIRRPRQRVRAVSAATLARNAMPGEPKAMPEQNPLMLAILALIDTTRMTKKEEQACYTIIHYLKELEATAKGVITV